MVQLQDGRPVRPPHKIEGVFQEKMWSKKLGLVGFLDILVGFLDNLVKRQFPEVRQLIKHGSLFFLTKDKLKA